MYHLRSALDQLAVTLAQAKGALASREVYFPIAKDIAAFENANGRAQKFLDGVEPWAADEIRGLKPYKGGTDKLWGLHALAQVDKHNSLIALGVAKGSTLFQRITVRNPKIGMIVGDIKGRLDKGILVSNLGQDGVFDRSEGNIDVRGYLAFGDEIEVFGNEPVVPTLQGMAHYVDQVIDKFWQANLG